MGSTLTDSAWIVREPAICGEVRGRVLDEAGRQPMAEAYVTLDSSSSGVGTDSLGRFRFVLPHDKSSVLTRPTFLRIRRVGAMEVRVFLPAAFGYAVEVQLPSLALHADHLATVRIKSPGFCGRDPDADEGAVVTNHALVVVFPVAPRPAAAWTAPGQGPASGFPYYSWRFGVSGVNGFTVIASVDKDSRDAANARGSLEAVVSHLELRRCGPGGHILECPQTIAGSVQATDVSVLVTVRDSAIVERLLRERPQYLWRSVFFPDAFMGLDSTRIRYAP